MRILFALAYYHPYVGGAESAFKGLAEELVRRGHYVRVVTARLPGTRAGESIGGVEVERVRVPAMGDRYFFAVLGLPHIARRLRDHDVVHTASNNLSPPLLALARTLGRPVVFTCHEVIGKRWALVESVPWRTWLYRTVEHVNVRMPYDRHVAVSEATRGDLIRSGVPGNRIGVVLNGLDEVFMPGPEERGRLRSELGVGDDAFLYVYFGRPGKTKGVDYLLRAAREVAHSVPHSHLALFLARAPAGPYAELMDLLRRLGSPPNIHLRPPVADRAALRRYLLDADCVVVPSLTEGFGLTTVETCALGVPVVATRAGSIPEVISGRHVLVQPGSVPALAAGIIRASRGEFDPPKPAQEFSWRRMAEGYEAQYRRVTGR